MAALMRCARFCTPAIQIPKLLRVVSSGPSQASVGLLFKDTSTVDQRTWRSTLAEGVETQHVAAPSTVDSLMNTVERYMRQFGRISRKQLDPIVASLDKEGSISVPNSLTLLRLYGSAVFDEPPAHRLKLAAELWEKYKEYGVPLEVAHYNTLLAVYNQNKLKFSPTEFLASMEASGIVPNRVTYQRLIARFCEEGDIQGATQVLEHMKSASLPINDQVFNSFITGHLRSNDPENARNIVEVMRQSGLEPTNTTYMTLAVGFAERGDIEEVKKYIRQAEIENVSLRPGQLLEVYTAFAVSGHTEHLTEVIKCLRDGTPFNQDAIRVCNQLIAAGHDEAAYQLFLEMPKPMRVDADQATLGRFFLRALARHERPIDKVAEFVKDMQTKELNKDDLSTVAHLAYLESQPVYALTVLEKMKSEGLPIRAHYFWPAFCQFKDTKNKEGVYRTMEKLNTLSDTRDDFIHTLYSFAIPALLAAGEQQDDITTKVQTYGFEQKEVNFAVFLHMLDQNKVQEATDFLESHEVSVSMPSVRACLQPLMGGEVQWRQMLPMLAKLKALSDRWPGPALEATAMVLKQIMVQQRKAGWVDAQEIFDFMVQNDLRIFRRSQTELSEYFAGAPSEVLQRLNELVQKDGAAWTERSPAEVVTDDLTIQELRQLVEQNPNNKSAQKRLIIKACAVGDIEEAEKVRSRLEAEGFVFPPIVLAQLGYLYAMFAKDLVKAQDYIQQLETRFPEHQNYQAVVLKLAALQASAGDTDAAVETLQRYADRHMQTAKKQEMKREDYYGDVVSSAVDADAAKRLMDTLITCGYVAKDNAVVLDRYMEKVVDSGDADKILQVFEEIVNTHRRSPNVDKVLQFFIHKEDPDRLQKVVDLLTDLHGLMNVFHHLIADFIECGHVKKARKIMETPGLRANMQRLNYYCQSFIERNMIKELEMLVEVTKDMFAVDRDNMLFQLIRGYVGQKELDKAKDVLLQYEEELLQPSARTLRFLARSLERAGMPVPFDVPDFQPLQREERGQRTERKAADGAAKATTSPASEASEAAKAESSAASQIKESILKGEVEAVLTALQGADKTMLSRALTQMKKPWPTEALTSIFETLGKQGELDALSAITEGRLPIPLRDFLKASIFTAAVNSGRAQEVIEKMEAVTTNSARYLSIPALDALQAKAPELMDRVERLAKKVQAEKNYMEPLSVLWCYYKYNNSPRADELMKEVPGFDKSVLLGPLCRIAVEENKVDMLESLLKMKKDVDEKRGMAITYSYLLQLHAKLGDVEATAKTCESIIGDGLLRSNLLLSCVKKAESLLTDNSKPLPAWADESSSSSSSESSSSSDEEKR